MMMMGNWSYREKMVGSNALFNLAQQALNNDGCFRRISDVIKYLSETPGIEDILGQEGSTIKLRFAADGRKTSKKVGSVMAVFSLLAEGKQSASHQYTVCLFNGKFFQSW